MEKVCADSFTFHLMKAIYLFLHDLFWKIIWLKRPWSIKSLIFYYFSINILELYSLQIHFDLSCKYLILKPELAQMKQNLFTLLHNTLSRVWHISIFVVCFSQISRSYFVSYNKLDCWMFLIIPQVWKSLKTWNS